MIRSVAPIDLLMFRHKPHHHMVFYNESLLVENHQAFWFAFRCMLQGNGRDRTVMTYHDRYINAMIQARGRNGRPEQDVLFLVAYGTPPHQLPSHYDIWYRLLEQLCMYAGGNHIERLYSAVWNDEHDAREIFHQTGFQCYTHHLLLQLSGPDWDQGTTLAPMRAQSRRDAWAIHKLYGAITPPQVQAAEVRSPRAWMLPLAQRWKTSCYRGWVLGSEDHVQAYLYVLSGSLAHVITILIHPDVRESIADVLRFGLAQLYDSRPIYFLLREYHHELLHPLQQLGFQLINQQNLLVKRTTVPIRKTMLLPAFEATSWDAHVTMPSISVPRGETQPYVYTTHHTKRT